MKKFILLITLLFIITGCSNSIVYEFKEDEINSNIEISFTKEEFENYMKENSEHQEENSEIEESLEELIEQSYEELSFIAIEEDDKTSYYEPIESKQKNDEYIYKYGYNFNYDNFSDNYYLNNCFEYYNTTEDDDYYHYKLSGLFTCDTSNSFKLEIVAKDKYIISNADKKDNNSHIWNIKEDDNDITFSISKASKKEKNKISIIYILGFILILILIILACTLYKFTNKDR